MNSANAVAHSRLRHMSRSGVARMSGKLVVRCSQSADEAMGRHHCETAATGFVVEGALTGSSRAMSHACLTRTARTAMSKIMLSTRLRSSFGMHHNIQVE